MINKFKDPISALTHIIGAILSLAGLVVLVCEAAAKATAWHVVSFAIYGTSLVALYTASSLYHSLKLSKCGDAILRQLDHAMIYVLIAGTYTPICLVALKGAWGWSLFGINWGLAVIGVTLSLVFQNQRKWLIVVLFAFYIIMGWLIVVAFVPLIKVLPSGGIFWLIAGGIFYTAGTVFLNSKNLTIVPGLVGPHEIWHLFVIAGSVSHFWLMFKYVMYLR